MDEHRPSPLSRSPAAPDSMTGPRSHGRRAPPQGSAAGADAPHRPTSRSHQGLDDQAPPPPPLSPRSHQGLEDQAEVVAVLEGAQHADAVAPPLGVRLAELAQDHLLHLPRLVHRVIGANDLDGHLRVGACGGRGELGCELGGVGCGGVGWGGVGRVRCGEGGVDDQLVRAGHRVGRPAGRGAWGPGAGDQQTEGVSCG